MTDSVKSNLMEIYLQFTSECIKSIPESDLASKESVKNMEFDLASKESVVNMEFTLNSFTRCKRQETQSHQSLKRTSKTLCLRTRKPLRSDKQFEKGGKGLF